MEINQQKIDRDVMIVLTRLWALWCGASVQLHVLDSVDTNVADLLSTIFFFDGTVTLLFR
jgi:hypothetical protein